MKKVLLGILLLVAMATMSGCEMSEIAGFEMPTINNKTSIDWKANGISVNDNINSYSCFDSILSSKSYDSNGNLSYIVKYDSAYIFNTTGSINSSLKTKKFTGVSVRTYKNSDLIKKVSVSCKDSHRTQNEILFLIKDAFGSCDSSKIRTTGSKKWPYSYSIYYEDEIGGIDFTLHYFESSDYHLGVKYGNPYITLSYEGKE